MKTKKLIVSLLLTTVMTLTFMTTFKVSASAESKSMSNSNESKVKYNALVINKNIPEAIDVNEAKAKKHINRLVDKEDSLEKIVYANEDGSETTYLFKEPVKYIGENGKIKDKNNKLSKVVKNDKIYKNKKLKDSQEYSYVNADNDINTYFPKNISKNKGIFLQSKNINISMFPYTSSTSNVKKENNAVYYDNVFGESTSLRYETVFSGFKEDIVLEKYVGNKFKFIIDTAGLIPVSNNGSIELKNDNGDVCATVSPIYVYGSSKDEAQFTYDNKLDYKKIEGNKYEIVITVDDNFLRNPNTVYPVYVDPTVTINSTGSGSGKTIIDTPIYNGSGVSKVTGGVNPTAIIGRVNSSYGSGRLLMRFPGLMSQSFMKNSTITSAKLIMKEVSGQSATANIYAYNYTGPAWNESTTYSASAWNGVGSYLDYWWFNYPNNTTKSYDILSAVKLWQTNPSQGAKGIILKNNTSEADYSKSKSFSTSEGAIKPYLSVTYFYNGVKGYRYISEYEASYNPNVYYVNCLAYAFFLNNDTFRNYYLTDADVSYCRNTSVSNALARTKTRMKAWLNAKFSGKWREVNSYDAPLNSNEWLVAMRVGVGWNGSSYYDYHFWYRASNGKWYNMHGMRSESEEVSGDVVNPSTAYYSDGWQINGIINYYSSNTVYYAIKQ